jgi:osmotically-inducible protein OsmY
MALRTSQTNLTKNMKLLKKLTIASSIASISLSLPLWAADVNNSSHDGSVTQKGAWSGDATIDHDSTAGTSSSKTSSGTQSRKHKRSTSSELASTSTKSNSNRSADSNAQSSRTDDKNLAQMTKASKASELIGMKVKNQQNESLGSVKDLIVDLHTGKVNYAVISSGGVIGLGNRLAAVPSKEFTYDRDDNALVLNVDKDRLSNAPQFDDNAFASSPNWNRDVDRFFSNRGTSASAKSFSSRDNNDNALQPTGKSKAERSNSNDSDGKSDSSLKKEIKQKVGDDNSLSDSAKNITINVDNGVVTLRGTVASEQEKNQIFAKAEQCAGSHKVINELEVK